LANLIVRNVDDAIVLALKARASLEGISAEAVHRKILAAALLKPAKKSFVDVLRTIPNVGTDSDFDRIQDEGANNLIS
jgi:plasmid stability protein